MTKIGDVDMLDMDAPLTLETLHNIMAAGHRRGPRRGGAGTGAGGRAEGAATQGREVTRRR